MSANPLRGTIDANVLVCMFDWRYPAKKEAAFFAFESLKECDCLLALQACGELYTALTKKLGRAPWEAAQVTRNILTSFHSFPASERAVDRALSEAMAGRFGYWDALLLASAHEAGCRFCLTEDMKDGEILGDVEVVHAFDSKGRISDRARQTLERAKAS
jgi:predicted nucleic acid-binding protein